MSAHMPFIYSSLIILLSYSLKKAGLFKSSDATLLSKVVMNLTFPALILLNVSSTPLSSELFLLPALPVLMGGMGLALGLLFFRKESPDRYGLMLSASMGLNIGLFAIPILEGLFGSEGLRIAAAMDIGNSFTIFVMSYLTAARFSPRQESGGAGMIGIFKVFIKSAPFMSYLAAIILNLTRIGIPAPVQAGLTILSRGNQFLILLILGLLLNFNWKHYSRRDVMGLILVRYIVAAAAGVLLWFLAPFDAQTRKIILMCLPLPVGFTLIPYSMEFGYDETAAGGIVNFTLVLGFLAMWILMALL